MKKLIDRAGMGVTLEMALLRNDQKFPFYRYNLQYFDKTRPSQDSKAAKLYNASHELFKSYFS